MDGKTVIHLSNRPQNTPLRCVINKLVLAKAPFLVTQTLTLH